MTSVISRNSVLTWILSIVILALCDEYPRFWVCIESNCYYSSSSVMNQSDAVEYCKMHNMMPGMLLPKHYDNLRHVPFAGKYTWIGIRRVSRRTWTFLSGQLAPAIESSAAAQHGEAVCAYQDDSQVFGNECYMKKKYVCQNQNESNFTVHHTNLSWYEARNYCIEQGGDLYDPNVYGWRIFGNEQFWIGVWRENFTWTATGKEVDVTYWSPSQPHGNGSCVTFTNNGWYLFDCQEPGAQALCVRLPEPIKTTKVRQTTKPSLGTYSTTSSLGPQNINLSTDSDAFPQSTSQLNELSSIQTTQSSKDVGSNYEDNKIKTENGTESPTKSDSPGELQNRQAGDTMDTAIYIGGGVAGALAVLGIVFTVGFLCGRSRNKQTETQTQEAPSNFTRAGPYEEISETSRTDGFIPKYMNSETQPDTYSSPNYYQLAPKNPYVNY